MRCYLLKNGHIVFVEPLEVADDEGLVAQSKELFELKGRPHGAEGFEVWDRERFIYRWPSEQ